MWGSGCTGSHALAWSVLPWVAEAFGSLPGAAVVVLQVAECRRGDEGELGSHPAGRWRNTSLLRGSWSTPVNRGYPSHTAELCWLCSCLLGCHVGSEAPMYRLWCPGPHAWTSGCMHPHTERGGPVRVHGRISSGERLTSSIQDSSQRGIKAHEDSLSQLLPRPVHVGG